MNVITKFDIINFVTTVDAMMMPQRQKKRMDIVVMF